MESKSLLEQIQSKYIANNVLSYLKDSNYILLCLVKYCKRIQNLFNIRIKDYRMKSYEITNYSKFEDFLYVKRSSKFKKNYLKNKFKEDLKQYCVKLRDIIANKYSEIYFTNKYNSYQINQGNDQIENISDNQLIIDIQSPFYDSLSKNPIFQNLFIIRIPIPLIKENDLMKDYINEFENLNKLNNNYSSICFQFDKETEEYYDIQKFNINFQKIKKLIFEEKAPKPKDKKYFNTAYNEISFFPFKIIFSNDNVVLNNLIFLEIKNLRINPKVLDICVLEKINNLKSLEELRLENIKFEKEFILKINTLKYLALCNCYNIAISNNCALNLKSLSLYCSTLISSYSSCLKFPELEQLKISFCFYNNNTYYYFSPGDWYQKFQKIIDFKSLKKLKYLLRGDISVLLDLENNLLEKAYISSYTFGSYQFEINMIKKFIDIKTLKEIKLSLFRININELESIKGENTSVQKLIIDFNVINSQKDHLLYALQKKFPNLIEIEIYDHSGIREIKLDKNSKIKRLKYFKCNSSNKISIPSFQHLKELELSNITQIRNAINNNNYYDNFKSLIKFQIDNSNKRILTDINLIKNIICNINRMPKLKCFILKCFADIKENEYNNLIKNILELKIKSIEFGINSFILRKDIEDKYISTYEYTEDELKSLYKNVDFKFFENIKIYKFNKYWENFY